MAVSLPWYLTKDPNSGKRPTQGPPQTSNPWTPNPKRFFSASPEPNSKPKLILLRPGPPPSLGRDTLGLGRHSGVGHSRETLGWALGTVGKTLGWALQGESGVGQTLWVGQLRETLGLGRHSGLGTLGRLWAWALQGHFGVGHSRDE